MKYVIFHCPGFSLVFVKDEMGLRFLYEIDGVLIKVNFGYHVVNDVAKKPYLHPYQSFFVSNSLLFVSSIFTIKYRILSRIQLSSYIDLIFEIRYETDKNTLTKYNDLSNYGWKTVKCLDGKTSKQFVSNV